MAYFDYSATTKVEESVLDTYNKVIKDYFYNPNSIYEDALQVKKLIDRATLNIKETLKIDGDIIYTSSASEANNLALKGICSKYRNRGHIIMTTLYEHPSIYETLKYLEGFGFKTLFIPYKNKELDYDFIKENLSSDVLMITTSLVSSELGIVTDYQKIRSLLKSYPDIFYHVDAVQGFTKLPILFDAIDLLTISGHKIFAPKSIGFLYKKKSVELDPLIHGGASTSIYRSGTPDAALIASLSKAIRLGYERMKEHYNYVSHLRDDLLLFLKDYPHILVNSSSYPFILNLSFEGEKGEVVQRYFDMENILLSTKSSCSSKKDYSEVVYNYTLSKDRATSSIRISLSYKTSQEDIQLLKKAIEKIYNKLYS